MNRTRQGAPTPNDDPLAAARGVLAAIPLSAALWALVLIALA